MKGSLSINTNFLPYAGPSEQGLQGLPNQNFVNNTSKTFYLKKALEIDICTCPQIFKPSYGPALLLQPKPRPYVTPGKCVLRIKNFNLSSFLTPNNPNHCIYVLFFFLLIPNGRQFYYCGRVVRDFEREAKTMCNF